MPRLRPEASALLELGLLFLPGIPAWLWLWPALPAGGWLPDLVNVLVYLYVLAGAVFIGRRRWTWGELGLNRRGIGLALACGAVLIAERGLAQVALGQPLSLRPFHPGRLAWEIVFYFALVGFIEELLFRGLLYRALKDLRGPGLAVFGSALGFAIWHIGWAGPLAAGHFVLGVVFALIRWRAGGIVGLIVFHGLFDLVGVETLVPVVTGPESLASIAIANPWAVAVGDLLLIGLVVYLWKGFPAPPGRAAQP